MLQISSPDEAMNALSLSTTVTISYTAYVYLSVCLSVYDQVIQMRIYMLGMLPSSSPASAEERERTREVVEEVLRGDEERKRRAVIV